MAWDHSCLGQVSILLLTYPPGSVGTPSHPEGTLCVCPIIQLDCRLQCRKQSSEPIRSALSAEWVFSSQCLGTHWILRPSSNAHPLVLLYPCPSPHNTRATLLVINWILSLIHLQKPWHTTSTPPPLPPPSATVFGDSIYEKAMRAGSSVSKPYYSTCLYRGYQEKPSICKLEIDHSSSMSQGPNLCCYEELSVCCLSCTKCGT